jgi:hypothetical protein
VAGRIVIAVSETPFPRLALMPGATMASSSASMNVMSQPVCARGLRRLILNMLGPLLLLGGYATNAAASEDVALEELGADRCYMFSLLVPHKTKGNQSTALPFELVINDEVAYQKLVDPEIQKQNCSDTDLKAIANVDFAKKTVLGLWTSGSCDDTFKRTVLRDDLNKSIIYAVTTVPGAVSGVCMRQVPESLNLIAIPKIPDGYKIIFENIHQ